MLLGHRVPDRRTTVVRSGSNRSSPASPEPGNRSGRNAAAGSRPVNGTVNGSIGRVTRATR